MKVTMKEVAEKLKAAEKILITAHVHSDGDALGSALGMWLALRQLGKDAQVYIDDELPSNLAFLPHFDAIKRPAAGEKFDADLLLVLDTAVDRIGCIRQMTDAPILNVDHHVTNKSTENDLYLESDAAATCEIDVEILHELDVKITPDMATCIYTGIATDTGFFNYSSTKAKTFRAAAELVECGAQPNFVSEQTEKRTLNDVKVMTAALQTVEIYFGGKVAGMFIDSELEKIVDTTEGLVDLIRVIDTVDVAFLLRCQEKNICRVSLRSKNTNVSDIARKLGGGGHIRAAGCTLYMNFEDAKKTLIQALSEHFS